MKKQKIFYLNFIRVISMLFIVTYHFYCHIPENNIVATNTIFSSGKWGMIGVVMFFMISGAALMYNYQEHLDIKKYAVKRFVGIFPMFWIAYASLYLYLFYQAKANITSLSPFRLIFSVFAMDGYLGCYTPTIYLIGEWFLGCIVIIYVLFPLYRILVNKYPKITLFVATVLNFALLIFYKNWTMQIDKNLIVASYSFILGMYAVRINQFKWWQAIIGAIISAVFYMLPAANHNYQVMFANLAAYALFVALAYVGQKLTNEIVQKIFDIISKYSYAVFLVHHYIIMKTLSTFQGREFGIAGTVLLYLVCWAQIIILAKLLYMVNDGVIKVFKKSKKEQIKEPNAVLAKE